MHRLVPSLRLQVQVFEADSIPVPLPIGTEVVVQCSFGGILFETSPSTLKTTITGKLSWLSGNFMTWDISPRQLAHARATNPSLRLDIIARILEPGKGLPLEFSPGKVLGFALLPLSKLEGALHGKAPFDDWLPLFGTGTNTVSGAARAFLKPRMRVAGAISRIPPSPPKPLSLPQNEDRKEVALDSSMAEDTMSDTTHQIPSAHHPSASPPPNGFDSRSKTLTRTTLVPSDSQTNAQGVAPWSSSLADAMLSVTEPTSVTFASPMRSRSSNIAVGTSQCGSFITLTDLQNPDTQSAKFALSITFDQVTGHIDNSLFTQLSDQLSSLSYTIFGVVVSTPYLRLTVNYQDPSQSVALEPSALPITLDWDVQYSSRSEFSIQSSLEHLHAFLQSISPVPVALTSGTEPIATFPLPLDQILTSAMGDTVKPGLSNSAFPYEGLEMECILPASHVCISKSNQLFLHTKVRIEFMSDDAEVASDLSTDRLSQQLFDGEATGMTHGQGAPFAEIPDLPQPRRTTSTTDRDSEPLVEALPTSVPGNAREKGQLLPSSESTPSASSPLFDITLVLSRMNVYPMKLVLLSTDGEAARTAQSYLNEHGIYSLDNAEQGDHEPSRGTPPVCMQETNALVRIFYQCVVDEATRAILSPTTYESLHSLEHEALREQQRNSRSPSTNAEIARIERLLRSRLRRSLHAWKSRVQKRFRRYTRPLLDATGVASAVPHALFDEILSFDLGDGENKKHAAGRGRMHPEDRESQPLVPSLVLDYICNHAFKDEFDPDSLLDLIFDDSAGAAGLLEDSGRKEGVVGSTKSAAASDTQGALAKFPFSMLPVLSTSASQQLNQCIGVDGIAIELPASATSLHSFDSSATSSTTVELDEGLNLYLPTSLQLYPTVASAGVSSSSKHNASKRYLLPETVSICAPDSVVFDVLAPSARGSNEQSNTSRNDENETEPISLLREDTVLRGSVSADFLRSCFARMEEATDYLPEDQLYCILEVPLYAADTSVTTASLPIAHIHVLLTPHDPSVVPALQVPSMITRDSTAECLYANAHPACPLFDPDIPHPNRSVHASIVYWPQAIPLLDPIPTSKVAPNEYFSKQAEAAAMPSQETDFVSGRPLSERDDSATRSATRAQRSKDNALDVGDTYDSDSGGGDDEKDPAMPTVLALSKLLSTSSRHETYVPQYKDLPSLSTTTFAAAADFLHSAPLPRVFDTFRTRTDAAAPLVAFLDASDTQPAVPEVPEVPEVDQAAAATFLPHPLTGLVGAPERRRYRLVFDCRRLAHCGISAQAMVLLSFHHWSEVLHRYGGCFLAGHSCSPSLRTPAASQMPLLATARSRLRKGTDGHLLSASLCVLDVLMPPTGIRELLSAPVEVGLWGTPLAVNTRRNNRNSTLLHLDSLSDSALPFSRSERNPIFESQQPLDELYEEVLPRALSFSQSEHDFMLQGDGKEPASLSKNASFPRTSMLPMDQSNALVQAPPKLFGVGETSLAPLLHLPGSYKCPEKHVLIGSKHHYLAYLKDRFKVLVQDAVQASEPPYATAFGWNAASPVHLSESNVQSAVQKAEKAMRALFFPTVFRSHAVSVPIYSYSNSESPGTGSSHLFHDSSAFSAKSPSQRETSHTHSTVHLDLAAAQGEEVTATRVCELQLSITFEDFGPVSENDKIVIVSMEQNDTSRSAGATTATTAATAAMHQPTEAESRVSQGAPNTSNISFEEEERAVARAHGTPDANESFASGLMDLTIPDISSDLSTLQASVPDVSSYSVPSTAARSPPPPCKLYQLSGTMTVFQPPLGLLYDTQFQSAYRQRHSFSSAPPSHPLRSYHMSHQGAASPATSLTHGIDGAIPSPGASSAGAAPVAAPPLSAPNLPASSALEVEEAVLLRLPGVRSRIVTLVNRYADEEYTKLAAWKAELEQENNARRQEWDDSAKVYLKAREEEIQKALEMSWAEKESVRQAITTETWQKMKETEAKLKKLLAEAEKKAAMAEMTREKAEKDGKQKILELQSLQSRLKEEVLHEKELLRQREVFHKTTIKSLQMEVSEERLKNRQLYEEIQKLRQELSAGPQGQLLESVSHLEAQKDRLESDKRRLEGELQAAITGREEAQLVALELERHVGELQTLLQMKESEREEMLQLHWAESRGRMELAGERESLQAMRLEVEQLRRLADHVE